MHKPLLILKNTEERTAQRKAESQACKTGIPHVVRNAFENRYGVSLEDVRIHYNSSKPAELNADAYTQNNHVYIGPGQEKHLNHELGHVIQQKSGRIPATQIINGQPVNDDPRLERDADIIGSLSG